MKKYQIILADPPWKYEEQLEWEDKSIFPLEHFYPTMELEDIKGLKIPAEDNAWLILWTTVPKILEGFEVLTAWGFNYRTMGIWNKGNGLGYFFRIYHEIILIGKKGNPPQPIYSEKSIFEEHRKAHSEKPQCIYRWIDKAFPNLTKIELFARPDLPLFPKKNGWDVWGNEVESDIEF